MVQKIVVAGSDSLRDVLTAEGVPGIADTPTLFPDVLNTIYQMTSDKELLGVFAFLPADISPEIVSWLQQYKEPLNGAMYILSADASISLIPLPSTLDKLFVAIGYDPTIVGHLSKYTIDERGYVADSSQRQPAFTIPEPTTFVAPEPDVAAPEPTFVAPEPVSRPASVLPTAYERDGGAKIIWSIAGKGGVGKSTMSMLAAIYMAAHRDMPRVLLIDGNVNQGDLIRFLQVPLPEFKNVRRHIPTVSDYPNGGLQACVCRLGDYIGHTGAELFSQINLDVVLGNVNNIEDNSGTYVQLVDSYAKLISDARNVYDLIVVDTQIIEPRYVTSSLAVSKFEIPFMRTPDNYIVGVISDNNATYSNTIDVLSQLQGRYGIGKDKMALVENMASGDIAPDIDLIERSSGFAVLGAIRNNSTNAEVARSLTNIAASQEIQSTLRRMRSWVFNLPIEHEPEPEGKRRKSFFGGRKK